MKKRAARAHDFASALAKLYRLLGRRERWQVVGLVALMVTAAGLEVFGVGAVPAFVSAIVQPEMLKEYPPLANLIDGLGIGDDTELLMYGVVGLVGVFAVKNTFLVLNHYCQKRFISARRIALADRLVRAYMAAPYTFHLTRNTSELIRNVEREVSLVAGQVIAPLLQIMTRIFIMAAVLAFLLVAEPWITLVWLAIFGILAGGAVLAVSARLKNLGLEAQTHRQRVVQRLTEGFGSIKESRILNREGFFAEQITDSVRRMSEALRFKQFTSAAVHPLTELLAIAGLAAIAVALVLIGRPTDSILVTLAMFAVGLVRLRETVSVAMGNLTNLRYTIVAVDPLYEDIVALERDAPPPANDVASAPRPVRQAIRLENVAFAYDEDEPPALSDISLTIPAGSAVGLVGSTGAGKSTLVDVILGLLAPTQGRVCVDGADIHDELDGWQRSIGYVPQHIFLLDDTIRNNVALGQADEEIDEGRVQAALRAAQLEDFVARMPEGVETVVGERGARLSGGERQRLGIARALYQDPDVLVLDEATSALDSSTERAIIEAVEALRGQRTIIMIAHRLSTVKSCDTLFLLNRGRVEASGTYAELEAQSADFRRMAQAQ